MCEQHKHGMAHCKLELFIQLELWEGFPERGAFYGVEIGYI